MSDRIYFQESPHSPAQREGKATKYYSEHRSAPTMPNPML